VHYIYTFSLLLGMLLLATTEMSLFTEIIVCVVTAMKTCG